MSKYFLSFVPRRPSTLTTSGSAEDVVDDSMVKSSRWTSTKNVSIKPKLDTSIIDITPELDRGVLKGLANITLSKGVKLCCDKCDGKHETSDCPHYKQKRDEHPDAQKSFYKKMGGTSSLPLPVINRATVMRQPGDGSCLFHSLSYGLGSRYNAAGVRKQICGFIKQNPSFQICETPLSDWIRWDSGSTCAAYSSRMSGGAWGGGIEMACASQIYKVNVHVYERSRRGSGYLRISAFDYPDEPEKRRTVRVVYQGGVHYDALVV